MNKTKLKVIAGILLVFLLGVLCGVLGTGIVIKHGIQRFANRTPREHKNFFVERLSKKLELTDTQKQEVEQIFSSTEDDIQKLLETSRGQFSVLMDQRRTQLQKILNPEQQEKLDAFFEQIEKHRPGFPPVPHAPSQ